MPALSTRRAPSGVLEKLREIDPKAELVHLGGSTWWLGVVGPNQPARDRILRSLGTMDGVASATMAVADPFERAMAQEHLAKETRMYQIMAYGPNGEGGFRPIELRECETLADFNELVEDFRRADWTWRKLGFKAVDKLRQARDRGTQFIDRIQQDARSWFRHFVKQSVSFLSPGLPKSPNQE